MIFARLDTSRPALARCVATLRAILDDVDLAQLDRAVTGSTTEELDVLRGDLDALLEQLDDVAHASDEDRDRLDELGAPVDGGGRWTVENEAPAWKRSVVSAAMGPAFDAGRALGDATRVRVVVDFRATRAAEGGDPR